MKLLTSILAAALYTTTVSGTAIERRQSISCIEYEKHIGFYHNNYYESCVPLINDCLDKVVNVTDNIWGQNSCVASATCTGSGTLIHLAQCRQPSFPNATDTASLDYTNIYANIVGECAWQEGGCPITQQNYIDFIYGAISAINSTDWPQDAQQVINDWWTPLEEWTATGDNVPYLNFDDWLHYSNSG